MPPSKIRRPPAPRALSIPLASIEVDEAWNTRDPEQADEAADRALAESIRELGLLQPLGVCPLEGGRYRLVYGFRRARAARELQLTEVPVVLVAEGQARAANVAENALRRQLSPGELLYALARARAEDPKRTTEELGRDAGLSASHVANLLRLSRRLCPELLSAYRERGETMHLKYLLEVCTLPHADQPEAYSARVTGSRGGRPKGSESGAAPPKALAEPKHVRKWLKDLGAHEATDYARGAEMALKCVLGRRAWYLEPANDSE